VETAAPPEKAPPVDKPAPVERAAPVEKPAPVEKAAPTEAAPARPEPQPEPARRHRRGALITGAAAGVVAAAVAVWLAVAPGTTNQDRPAAQPTATTTTSAPSTGSTGSTQGGPAVTSAPSGPPPSATATTGTATANGTTARPRPPLPAGWRDYRDPTGFRVYVPSGWTRSKEGSIVYFRNYRTGQVLGIDQTNKPQWNPVADWRGKADYRVRTGDFPGYHEIHIVAVPYFRKAADWEFTFNGRSARQHVNNRGFVVSNTQAYGIYWQTRDADWAATRKDLQLIFDSFRPAKA
jgi:hypothetical protein